MRAAVLGSPIAHSLSPAMHRAAYAAAGLDWTYEAIEVPAGGLAGFVEARDDEWRGLSVTAPLKAEAAACASSRTDVVERLGVANTLVHDGAGRWSADNTDIPGAVNALAEAGVTGVRSVRILGGGATATAMAHAVASVGATSVEIAVRDTARAEGALAAGLAAGADEVRAVSLQDASSEHVDLLISTIPVVAVAERADAWAGSADALFDVVYDPWPTALALAAEARGLPVVSGLDLLAHQAILQLEQMARVQVDADLLRAAAQAELAAR